MQQLGVKKRDGDGKTECHNQPMSETKGEKDVCDKLLAILLH